MTVKARITEDMKTAMKARDKDLLSVLRMLLSEIKYAQAQINVQQELPEEEVIKVVATYQKRLVKSLDDFPEGEKRDQIRAELKMIEPYLPKKADAETVRKAVVEILKSTSERAFGPLMKDVLGKLGDAADGKVVSQILKEELAKS